MSEYSTSGFLKPNIHSVEGYFFHKGSYFSFNSMVAGPRLELGTLAYETSEMPISTHPAILAVRGGFEPSIQRFNKDTQNKLNISGQPNYILSISLSAPPR